MYVFAQLICACTHRVSINLLIIQNVKSHLTCTVHDIQLRFRYINDSLLTHRQLVNLCEIWIFFVSNLDLLVSILNLN